MTIALVTDSTADLPPHLIAQYGITVVPSILIIEGKSYRDGEGISRQEFYRRLPSMPALPTTASPSVGDFQRTYADLLKKGAETILSIHPPIHLTGIYNAARLAAESFGERVRVLDGKQLTLGLGFQVLAAAEAIRQGAKLNEVLSLIESVRSRVRVVALLDTLEYVRRSGRVSWARAKVGQFLRLKPLIGLRDGVVENLGQARTYRQGLERLYCSIRELGRLERLAILHTGAESIARRLLGRVQKELPFSPLLVHVTTVIGTHVGPNGVGFAAVKA
ncbi:MAG: DegV family protein [Anaerolineae bacterium]|nr:MAG: DegV family protein [Anaerolineae bacterium]